MVVIEFFRVAQCLAQAHIGRGSRADKIRIIGTCSLTKCVVYERICLATGKIGFANRSCIRSNVFPNTRKLPFAPTVIPTVIRGHFTVVIGNRFIAKGSQFVCTISKGFRSRRACQGIVGSSIIVSFYKFVFSVSIYDPITLLLGFPYSNNR